MRAMDTEKEIKRRAYSTLVGSIIIIAIVYSTVMTLSIYVGELCLRLNASITEITLMFTVSATTQLIANLLVGPLMERVPVRLIVLMGAVCCLLFYLCMRFAASLIVLYIGSGLFGISNAFAGFATLQPLVTWWHTKRIGTKLSMISVGYSLFGILLSAVMPGLLTSVGFDTLILVYGAAAGVITVICSAALLSEKPAKYGLEPYGYSGGAADGITIKNVEEGSCALKSTDILKNRRFWILMASVFFISIASMGFVNNASVYYQSLGLSPVESGYMISVYSFATMVLSALFGIMADRIGQKKTFVIFGAASTAAFALAAVLSGLTGAVVVAVMISAKSYINYIVPMNAGKIFGAAALGTAVPAGMASTSIGSMIGPPIAAMVYDSTGSFTTFMICGAVLCAAAIFMILKANAKAKS